MAGGWVRSTPLISSSTAHKRELDASEAAIKSRATIAHVAQEKTDAPMAYILFRGDYDKRRDEVKADTPDILPPFPAELPRNRLGYAPSGCCGPTIR